MDVSRSLVHKAPTNTLNVRYHRELLGRLAQLRPKQDRGSRPPVGFLRRARRQEAVNRSPARTEACRRHHNSYPRCVAWSTGDTVGRSGNSFPWLSKHRCNPCGNCARTVASVAKCRCPDRRLGPPSRSHTPSGHQNQHSQPSRKGSAP
jgi:hypothetical protein